MASKGLSTSIWSNGHSYKPTTKATHSSSSDLRSQSLPPTAAPPSIQSPARRSPSPPKEAAITAVTATAATTTMTAAATPRSTNTGPRLSPSQAFHRFEQACVRLRWKFLDLESSYSRAMSAVAYAFSPEEAERNFKVDFHEFYMWIEQALVLLLLIFNISISRDTHKGGIGGGSGGGWGHAYHHNVLKALEEDTCPVRDALGKGDVYQALWKAKELRNRWKDASEGKETPPLKMYDLTWIVTQILLGLEAAYGVAAAKVQEDVDQGRDVAITDENKDEWEWMVETMDWETC